jgi:hypothetical protein
LNDASTDVETIRGWWEKWPDANIAIATGPESGVFALDVDGEDGQASLKLLEAKDQLPKTLRVLTGRQGQSGERTGFHLYFNCPAGTNLNNRAGLLGKGLDIRAAGAYIVAPPSLHSSGLHYEWDGEEYKISEPPPWLIARGSRANDNAVSTLETRFLYKGERGDRLYRIAAKWRRDGATRDEIETRLRALNSRICKPPLEERRIKTTAISAAKLPVGGPDPLDSAWANAKAENHWYSYDKFLALIRHLECQRPGSLILLPVVRIGKLIGCDSTLVGRHRKRAIAEGIIQEVEKYIPHEKATRFKVIAANP